MSIHSGSSSKEKTRPLNLQFTPVLPTVFCMNLWTHATDPGLIDRRLLKEMSEWKFNRLEELRWCVEHILNIKQDRPQRFRSDKEFVEAYGALMGYKENVPMFTYATFNSLFYRVPLSEVFQKGEVFVPVAWSKLVINLAESGIITAELNLQDGVVDTEYEYVVTFQNGISQLLGALPQGFRKEKKGISAGRWQLKPPDTQDV